MPVEVASIMSTPFPSFMSVVGKADTTLAKDMEELPAPDSINCDTQFLVTDASPITDPLHQSAQSLHHRDSVTSMTSTSTESSPTTTNSTFDSPLIMDASPSSSPESATSNLPSSPFKSMMPQSTLEPAAPFQHRTFARAEVPSMPPPRLPAPLDTAKNVKNLSLNVSPVVLQRPATAHGFEGSHAFSAPSSPMKDTPRTGRRKPTNLTIRTPGFQQLSFPRPGLDVPPTPSSRPSLHHMASSPALASLGSPTKAPQGLFLHLPTSGSVHTGSMSGPNSDSSASSQPLNVNLPELREEDEMNGMKSQETQEKGYPNGPVLIYDEGLYLFLEPTADEACKFDTVINVAKEIKCPFPTTTVPSKPEITEPQTAISEMSFKSAWEWPRPSEVPTPTTPRPASFYQPKHPEYLHVLWDHNSEILDDLYSLCRLIEERIQTGKKVLIHCQLGVSRSASLVIAYGLYKGYQPDFHSMYMAVKKRSQWVGPNMSLIYQLTDFRSKVVKDVYGDHCYNPNASWWELQATNAFPMSDTPVANTSSWQTPRVNEYATQENAKTPVAQNRNFTPPTVRPGPPLRLNKALPPVPLFPKDATVATPVKLSQILGSIAKPSPPQPSSVEEKSVAQPASPRPLPFREQFEGKLSHQMALPEAKSPKLGLKIDSPMMDLAMQDVPDTPSLLSPRASEFMASPFAITVTSDLSTISNRNKSLKPSKSFVLPRHQAILPPANLNLAEDRVPTPFDPRSPHQHGEPVEILRHIDDFL
ncbi:uncharacterized protein A1O9_05842 [Exophiala aquamarina CBS 119918]|uniref:protein-tyrosine-phosphatase n=1 Tax=Exophiala aquamarina CBS 119918 TaxID=1182545 RepID=A0A072PQY0_9EURO|nr:uncharacterized protein A1O9_05842 [Exophiala aquamarina CBS 119918]KEF57920.1 hypothetical protein A1O9_05842 [Exophiala aquamarina CBS 119918]